MSRRFAAVLAGCLSLSSCAPSSTPEAQVIAGQRIKHVIFVIQENRSFDNLFHGLRGADTVDFGKTHDGESVRLRPVSFLAKYDISNGARDFVRSYDQGKMDGYDRRPIGPGPGAIGKRYHIPLGAYGYLPRNETKPYFQLAEQYVVGDRMFQSNIDQSFAAHLFLVAGQAMHTADVPTRKPWGCDGGPDNRVRLLRPDRSVGGRVYPCFTLRTLATELEEHQLTWRYYAPRVDSQERWAAYLRHRPPGYPAEQLRQPDFGQLWSAFDAVAPIRYGPDWDDNVVSPERTILHDARTGQLAAVSWVVPDWRNSDHALSKSATGPQWVSSIVNAVGSGPDWNSTVIAIVWDDSGGWYDHVPPPRLDRDGLGIRVPLIVVSPYAKRGVVSHTQYEFGSLLKFAEDVFGLPRLAASDRRANSIIDCLDFTQPARRFEPIATERGIAFFEKQIASRRAPDDD